MTTEKAIQLLHRLQDEQFDSEYGDERREALEMAVRALESNLVKESDGLVNDLVKDCIGRQEVAKWLERWDGYVDKDIIERMKLRVIDIPSAQPQRKKGKWIDNDKINFPQCSECGMWIDVMQQSGEMNYCPHCGADMKHTSEDLNREERKE